MTIIALVSKERVTTNTLVFQGPGTGIRTVYVEDGALLANDIMELALVEFIPLGPEAAAFVDFLDDRVEVFEEGRITSGEIWEGWTARCGAGPGGGPVEGISRQDAAKLFRARLGAQDQTRARINGRVQRCWRGYRLAPPAQ